MFLYIRRRKMRTLIIFLFAVFAVKYISVFAELLMDSDLSPTELQQLPIGRWIDSAPVRESSPPAEHGSIETSSTHAINVLAGQDNSTDSWSVDNLLAMLGDRWQYWWIKQRIQRTWKELEASALAMHDGRKCSTWTPVNRRKVMILPGLLTRTNFARPEVIRRGGALGELTQWADLIAACFALCHSIAVRYHIKGTENELLLELPDSPSSQQPTGCDSDYVDVIYTDIAALHELPPVIRNAYRYRLRVLDAFGTEPMYNDPEYIERHPELSEKVGWGGLGLRPKQFNTLYPHTPDNSFLGFVVLNNSVNAMKHSTVKDNYALVMGKSKRYFEDHIQAMNIIHEFLPLRVTVQPSDRLQQLLPSSTYYYGVVGSAEYQSIVAGAKLCVGLGDPIESPSVLEALAYGCVFLNPRRRPDSMRFKDKSTGRLVTSQVPYLEHFVGPPRVYTVDYDNVDELRELLLNITNNSTHNAVDAFIPREFSARGFLERLDAYLTHQNFCRPSSQNESPRVPAWPPLSALRIIPSSHGQSCVQACSDQGLVCEPDFFQVVNNVSYFSRSKELKSHCHHVNSVAEPYVPALAVTANASAIELTIFTCLLQARSEIFSCAEGHPGNGIRICPCRDFIRHQIALCKDCLRPISAKTST